MRKIVISIILYFAPICVFSSEIPRELLTRYFNSIGAQDKSVDEEKLKRHLEQFKKSIDLRPEQENKYAVFEKDFNTIVSTVYDKIEVETSDMISKEFTKEELLEIVRFLESEAGKKYTKRTEIINREVVQVARKYMKEEIQPKIQELSEGFLDGLFMDSVASLKKETKKYFSEEMIECAAYYRLTGEDLPPDLVVYTLSSSERALWSAKALTDDEFVSKRLEDELNKQKEIKNKNALTDIYAGKCNDVVAKRNSRVEFWKNSNLPNKTN